MKCIECGHELKDGAVFCIRCGAMQVSKSGEADVANTAPVRAVGTGASGSARHNQAAGKTFKPTPRRSTASVVVPIVAVVAVLAAVAALAMFVLNPSQSSQDSSSQVSATIAGSSSDSSSSSSASSSSASSSSASSKSSSSASSASTSATGTASSTGSANANSGNTSSTTNTTTSGNNSSNTGSQTYTPPAQTYTEPEPVATDGSYYLGDTSTRYYSRSEVENLSNYDLYYARNEIFARHGRMFQNSDLQAYFNSKSWYTPTYSPSEWAAMPSPLSDIEQKNSSLMLEVEQARKSPYL